MTRLMVRGLLAVALLGTTAIARASAAEGLLGTVAVEAGEHDRVGTPVSIALEGQGDWPERLVLVSAGGKQLPAQVEPSSPPRLWFVLDEKLAKGESREYRLEAASNQEESERQVRVEDDGERLCMSVGDSPVLCYQYAVMDPPNPKQPWFARSGMIHPVRSPSGRVLTDAMPKNHHTHQHAIMMAWVNTRYEGRKVDFWNSHERQGKVEHVETVSTTSGPVFGELVCRLRHIDLTSPEGPEEVLNETWRVRVFALQDRYLFDIESTQETATDEPLRLPEYHYGGMTLRGAPEWYERRNCQMITSEGLDRLKGNATRPKWVNMTGKIDGQPAGILVMGHPTNFRYPQPVRLHPEMPYFCFAPMVLGEFAIEPGKPYVSKYRYVAYDGELSADEANAVLHDYTHPVRGRLQSAE